MTNEGIEAQIDDINAGSAADRIFLRPLVGRVWTAAVWECEPRGRASNEGAHRFYFVFSDDGFCVAAIENLGGDLHALTKPEYRHRHIMEDTLRHVVLPHIFSSGVMNQTVQICSDAGRGLVRKLGFRFTSETWAEITPDLCPPVNFARPPSPPLSADRVTAIRDRIARSASLLRKVIDLLRGRLDSRTLDEIGYAASWVDSFNLGDAAFLEDMPSYAGPVLEPLPSTCPATLEPSYS